MQFWFIYVRSQHFTNSDYICFTILIDIYTQTQMIYIQGWSDNIQWHPHVCWCLLHRKGKVPAMVEHWWGHTNSTTTHGSRWVPLLLVSPCAAPSLPLFTVPFAPPCIHSHWTYYLWVNFFLKFLFHICTNKAKTYSSFFLGWLLIKPNAINLKIV